MALTSLSFLILKMTGANKRIFWLHNTGKAQELKVDLSNWLDEMLSSNNIVNKPYPIVGTKHENPSYLNLNDADVLKDSLSGKTLRVWGIHVVKAC